MGTIDMGPEVFFLSRGGLPIGAGFHARIAQRFKKA